MLHLDNRTPLSNKKERTTDKSNNTGWLSQTLCKRKKPDIKWYEPYNYELEIGPGVGLGAGRGCLDWGTERGLMEKEGVGNSHGH